ncbi:MAG: bifunctional methylenetetrahydrofolate dehydrogenase/methenyltetrahydrofolate cyclohydrolase FolD [Nitratiruptor sp.]|nr:bifunctional methylenetetrahydrofolate dehydrogenase/methenyltetrahydrofolate cyclohydrolase FolD [Nitratiruptor sp.]NPA83885.1 bifunctional methylenetetrahydrofolate dehydrogenase/methenyltetrahydrofolate cyclohydrolase FolD [Campylobacterota bacterium]
MVLLDGARLSKEIKEQIRHEAAQLKERRGITPTLSVILVGDDPASHTYVKMKERACKEVGFHSIVHTMPADITQNDIEETITSMNQDPNVDGILVQLPLPPHIDTTRILELIDPAKDVDGFHPYNFGRLVQGLETFAPCTPLGVMELLRAYGIDPKGLDACVVGASNIVGKPMAALLLNAFASVDVCHIYTKDLQSHTKRADLLVVGVGKPKLIGPEMVKEGAIVIDIGINRLPDGRLVGDVDFEGVSQKASYITPVPGGVGPMTIAMLLTNTIKAARKRRG